MDHLMTHAANKPLARAQVCSPARSLRARLLRGLRTGLVMLAVSSCLLACRDPKAAQKAQEKEAKRERDQTLAALPYPEPSGITPATLVSTYDPAADRTTLTLTLANLNATTPTTSRNAATLTLVSSHKGEQRKPGNPEGSIDATLQVRGVPAGALAFSGTPGVVHLESGDVELKLPAEGTAYSSEPNRETVRFRITTESLITAVNSRRLHLTVGTASVEVHNAAVADVREFASRLKPPAP